MQQGEEMLEKALRNREQVGSPLDLLSLYAWKRLRGMKDDDVCQGRICSLDEELLRYESSRYEWLEVKSMAVQRSI